MPRILFVSHDADLRAVASRVLQNAGCQVTAAAHAGHASLACMDGVRFDVLVIEDQMADGSSGAIAERLRRYCPNAQVIRMCDTMPALGTASISIVRPFTADDLIGAVSTATHPSYARRAATIR